VSSILIVRICRPALRLWRRIRHFDQYLEGLPLDVRDPNALLSVLKEPVVMLAAADTLPNTRLKLPGPVVVVELRL